MKKSEIISRLFFPERCPLCGALLKLNEDFCLCCGSEEMRLSDSCCEHCGKESGLCSCETAFTAPLPHITGAFVYDGLIKNMLISFKFGSRRDLHRRLGDSLAERVAVSFAKADFDTVTFVPASSESVNERGFNPAALIAKRTAEKLFLPCEELLVKGKSTEKQHSLRAKERMTNIKGSVEPKDGADVRGKIILLCDDIKTTGATLHECTQVLFSMGAQDVYCAAVAVTSNLNDFDLDKKGKNK